MISSLISRLLILFFGTLYPAYASYKAVRTKNVKEYVKWMMYWIVFAFFTCIETFTDIFISWFPFYYEVKVVLVFWLLSPATKGSSTLYRKFVHPMLTRHEQEIDEYLTQATERGYSAVLQLGSKGVNYATNVIMQTAIKTFALTTPAPGRSLQNSQSAGDLSAVRRNQDMMDGLDDWLPRSNSLSGIESYAEPEPQRRGMVIQEIHEEEPSHDAGAARLRDLPARRVQSRRAAAAASRAPVKRVSRAPDLEAPVSGTQGVRARRRLREPTPDVDVEND